MKQPEVRKKDLLYPELSYQIVGCSFEVFKALGYGHPEKIYQKAMAVLFKERGIAHKEQVYIPFKFHDKIIDKKFLDFIVDEKVVVELKKNFHFSKAHIDQVVKYLRESNCKLAILINFGKEGVTFKRIINETEKSTKNELVRTIHNEIGK
ncbi:MAG: GxxExxY protein [Bacteroidetes bacterium]|nr:GxxExxY protein [Bacteroidota bacterium]